MSTEQEIQAYLQFFEADQSESTSSVPTNFGRRISMLARIVYTRQLNEQQVCEELTQLANEVPGSVQHDQPVGGNVGSNTDPALLAQVNAISQQLANMQNELFMTKQQLAIVQAVPAATIIQGIVPELKLDNPGKFLGEPAKLQSWTFSVRQYGTLKGLSGEQMAAEVVSLLQGKAKTRCQSKAATGNYAWQLFVLEFDDLQAELEVVFGDDDRERKLILRFQTFIQKGDLLFYIANFVAYGQSQGPW